MLKFDLFPANSPVKVEVVGGPDPCDRSYSGKASRVVYLAGEGRGVADLDVLAARVGVDRCWKVVLPNSWFNLKTEQLY